MTGAGAAPKCPLRVLSISLGRRGGFPVYGLEMTKALAKLCDVRVLVASGAENIDEWRRLSCPRMETVTYHNTLGAALSLFNIPKFLTIKKFIDSCKPDVVYYPGSHTWKPLLDHLIPKPTLVAMTIHDPLPHPGEKYLMAQRFLSAIDTRMPDCYIMLNESQRSEFIKTQKISDDKVIVIPHGVFSSYKKALSRLDVFSEFQSLLGFERKYFLFVGRIVKYKGIETLLNAFERAADRTDKILVIAGSGDFSAREFDALEKIPEDRVKVFNHWLSDAEIATLTANAFMTVLPYEGATQSGIIPLASAFGTPSIASDSGGLSEQIADGRTGFLFPAGDVSRLEKTIISASEMADDEYREMRENSLRQAERNWDWDVLAGKLLDFLKRAASR